MRLSDKLAAQNAEKAAKKAPAKKAVAKKAAKKAPTKKAAAKKATGKAAAAKAAPKFGNTRDGERAGGRWNDAKRQVRDLVLRELAPKMSGPNALNGEDLQNEARDAVDIILAREDVEVSPAERRNFTAELLADLLGYGALDPLLRDPAVNEVMCNAYDQIYVEKAGKLTLTDIKFADRQAYRQVIDKIVLQAGRRLDESSPMVDARLPDGSRVNAIIPPIALSGASLTIRRFSEDPFTVQDLISFGSITDDLALVLEACVRGKLNILVSGGTGSGKTTLLNVMSRFIPEDERIVTIEDAAELRLQQPHVVTLETRPANAEGSGEVSIRDLVKNSLRMRPDRIVVGECRGGEALDMLQAMNTGHDGSLTTIHANTPRDAMSRLETLVLMAGMDLPQRAIREQIASAVDVIVQIERLPDGQRKITNLTEIQGMEDATIVLQDIFEYQPKVENGRHVGLIVPTGLRPRFLDKLAQEGVELPAAVMRNPNQGATRTAARTKKGR